MQKAWRGQVIHVEEQETYLERGDHLEENYFTWSTIPIKSCCGDVEGLMVPNFERTAGVISNRRMSTLHNISNLMTNGVSTNEIIESALKGIATNPKDLNFALVYSASLEKGHVDTASQAERVQNQANGLVGSLASGQVTSTLLTPLFASTGDRAQITFKFAGSTGCVALDDSGIPNLVTSQRSVPQSTTREKALPKPSETAISRMRLSYCMANKCPLFKRACDRTFGARFRPTLQSCPSGPLRTMQSMVFSLLVSVHACDTTSLMQSFSIS